MPAGSSKTTDYADGSGRGSSSFGPPVEHDSDVCLLTDAHSFSEESGWSCVDIDGATAVHGDADHGDEYLFGEVRTHDWDYDTAVVEHNSSVVDGPDNRIFAHNDDEVDVDGKPIWGHVTEWGLDNMYDEAETAYQTERTTGQTSGRLLEVTYGRTRCDDEVDFVKSGACTQGGDSGGIHYRHNYNEHKERWEFQVIGVHSAFGCDLYYKGTEPYEQYYSVAAPAYALSSELGVSFTVDSC